MVAAAVDRVVLGNCCVAGTATTLDVSNDTDGDGADGGGGGGGGGGGDSGRGAGWPRTSTNAFCLVRPPGHHAGRCGGTHGCDMNGFCLINNVVVGLMHARLRWGLRRVAVIDIDAHFGNGTAGTLTPFMLTLTLMLAQSSSLTSLQLAVVFVAKSLRWTPHLSARTYARMHAPMYMLELLQEDEESFFGSVHLHVPSSPSMASSSFAQRGDDNQVIVCP